jgi:hypothetical protein
MYHLILLGEVTMAKNANVVEVKSEITSLKDGAYQQARAGDKITSVARYVMSKVAGFPENLPDEAKVELVEGYRLRFNENNPAQEYAIVNGNYLLIDGSNEELKTAKERIKVGVDYAYSFSQQQFGQLGKDNPTLHAIVKDWRDRASSYCSNRIKDLKRQAKAILMSGVKRDRANTALFNTRLEDVFKDLASKCKLANDRGDETANIKKFNEAKIAFMVKWNTV